MSSESSRLANLISKRRECSIKEVAVKAAAFHNRDCNACVKLDLSGGELGNTINKPVPQSSSKLQTNILKCQNAGFLSVTGAEYGVPESVRLARFEQRTLDLSTSAFDPDSRFSMYRRPFIPVCPPIPQTYIRGGEPILQGKNCSLPNKPDNPVLPG